jgi:transposase-like protein
MRRSRFSEEQIIAILKEQEAGMATAELCRRHGISAATFYKWKSRYGGLEVSEAKRLRQLEDNQQTRIAIDPMSFELESRMTPELYSVLAIHFDLFSDRSFNSTGQRLFVFRLANDEIAILPPDLPESDGVNELPSFLSLNVSRIIRSIWDGIESEHPIRVEGAADEASSKSDNFTMTGGVLAHPAGRTNAPIGDDTDGETAS